MRRLDVFGLRIPLILAGLLVFVACSQSQSIDAGLSDVVITPPDPSKVVCDPFSTGNPNLQGAGLAANIAYLTADQPRYTSVSDYINFGHKVDATIYMNNLEVRTRPFDLGFVTQSGITLLNADGNTLYEWFALHFDSYLQLATGDVEGQYQLGMISDDGALAYVNDGGTWRVAVDNDGTHPSRFACATTPITMTGASKIPLKLDYYQGPRYHIALMLLWRPWTGDGSDPACGMSGNSTFFDSTQTPSAPMPTYNAMLSRGWKVIAPANYLLPQATGGVNPCNNSETPSPTISNVNVNSITNSSAVVTWDTDQPANSRIYFNTGSGAYAVGPFDTNLVQSHSITLTGLSGFTFYNVYVSSTNNQNKTSDTASSPLSFRTLR